MRVLLAEAVADGGDVGRAGPCGRRRSEICVCDSSIGVGGIAEHAHRLARAGDFGAAAGGIDVQLAQRRR